VRLLIVLPGALGDVIRALPLLGRLRRGRPDAHLAWAVEPPSAPLLSGHPWLDQVLVFERPWGVRAFPAFLRQVRAGGFTHALDLGRSIKSGVIARASGATTRYGFARADGREGGWLLATHRLPPQGRERAKLDQFLAFADALGLPPAPVEFGLAPAAADAAAAAQLTAGLPSPLIVASVGSSCPSRRWLPERTAAVLDGLATTTGGSGLLVGTASDAPFAAAVVRATRGRVRDLVGRTTLGQLTGVLALAGVVFGPDSGALHLGAALGRPVVSLWGATSALRSTPFGGERHVVQGAAPCAPCFLTRCPIGRVCMQAITVETVAAHAAGALAA